jgi:threonylcarbamoyladenosine tRNA methylthiotransferase MtaB
LSSAGSEIIVRETISLITFGCRLNQYDTQVLRTALVRAGCRVVEGYAENVDWAIVNTCIVTGRAERDARKALRRAARLSPRRGVVLTGCYAGLEEETDASFKGSIPEVLRYIGKCDLPDAAVETGSRARPLVKVQEGCDFSCSYCVVPSVRGRSRSRATPEILEEVQALAGKGFHEIVLTAIHLGAFDDGEIRLLGLVKKILKISNSFRIRLSSLSPAHVTEELIDLMADEPRICPHLHLPLQSGSERVLGDMNRPYALEEYRSIVETAIEKIPRLALGTDVIAGYPTETEDDFDATLRLLEEVPYAYIHVFEFSRRPGTRAESLKDVFTSGRRKERVREILKISQEKRLAFKRRFVGGVLDVLVERSGRRCRGLSDNYIIADFPSTGVQVGEIAKVKVKRAEVEKVYGSAIDQSQSRTETRTV